MVWDRSNSTNLLRILVYVGLVGMVIWYATTHGSELIVLMNLYWWSATLLIGASVVHQLVTAAHFQVLYRTFGVEMKIVESFGLSAIARGLNYALPFRGGGAARVVYLKNKYGVPYSQGIALMLGSIVLGLFVGSVIMLVTNTITVSLGYRVPVVLWVGASTAGVPVGFFWVSIPEKYTARWGKLGNMIRLFSRGWGILDADQKCLILAGFLQFLMFSISGIRIMLAYHALGIRLNPLVGVSIAVFTDFSRLVTITPSNLGIQEAVIGYLSRLSGVPFGHGVAAAVLMRAAVILIILVVAPISWYFLFFRKGIKNYVDAAVGHAGSALSGDSPQGYREPRG